MHEWMAGPSALRMLKEKAVLRGGVLPLYQQPKIILCSALAPDSMNRSNKGGWGVSTTVTPFGEDTRGTPGGSPSGV